MPRTISELHHDLREIPHSKPFVEMQHFQIPPNEIPVWQVFFLHKKFYTTTTGFDSAHILRPHGYVEVKTDREGMPIFDYEVRIKDTYAPYLLELLHEANTLFRGMTTLYPDIILHARIRWEWEKPTSGPPPNYTIIT